ncbi:MerR family transcriptional regulator [Polymorphospora lycopeni]|uniref:MerR family transcriptional regulator n=1 Tax=Polymorphospora lycopeni TaxID=3140240 RepID=A0ABV5CL35_9ACTN
MFTIGDFARLGRVSVRMLRHYDAIGLLTPATVDPATGYRFYRAAQLGRLNRVIALKDLGFTLPQVQAILDEDLGTDALRGMLRLRRAQLEAQIEADAARLTGIEARLQLIEKEGDMPTEDVVLKPVGPVRVAELTAVSPTYETVDIGPVIQPLYAELHRRLAVAGVKQTGPGIAYYTPAPDGPGEAVVVHATAQVDAGPHDGYDFEIVEVPAIPTAATIIHRGPMDNVEQSIQILARWVEDNGYRTDGYVREVYLDYCADDPAEGVTELQLAVTKS